MATIQDLKEKFQQIREAMHAKLPDIAMTVAITAKSLSERNIREKGFSYKYSTNKVPAWFFKGKELNGTGLAFLQGLKKKEVKESKGKVNKKESTKKVKDSDSIEGETTWGEFRGAQGLQSGFVDLGYTNKMWADMSPVEVKQDSDGITRAILGGRTRENQDKMNYNFARYGDFVKKGLGEKEKELLIDVAKEEMISLIEQFNL